MIALKYCCPKASECSLFVLLKDAKVHFAVGQSCCTELLLSGGPALALHSHLSSCHEKSIQGKKNSSVPARCVTRVALLSKPRPDGEEELGLSQGGGEEGQ